MFVKGGGGKFPKGGPNFLGNMAPGGAIFPRKFGPGGPYFGGAKFPGTPVKAALTVYTFPSYVYYCSAICFHCASLSRRKRKSPSSTMNKSGIKVVRLPTLRFLFGCRMSECGAKHSKVHVVIRSQVLSHGYSDRTEFYPCLKNVLAENVYSTPREG